MSFQSVQEDRVCEASEKSSTQLKARSCQLLLLPAELRNQIYCFHLSYIASALWPGNIVHIDTSSGRVTYGKKMPPLLQTCRQIRDEAIRILIEYRVFVFFGFGRARGRIRLGWHEPYVGYMRRVELRRWMDSTGYSLEWKRDEEIDAYEFRAPAICHSLVMERSTLVLDKIVVGSEKTGRRPALDPSALQELCKAILADEQEKEK